MSPFDLVKSITQTNDDLFTTDELFNKEYVPFMVNRILSNGPRTALFANAMNQYGILDKRLQYDFYRLGIPKAKSYTKWIKKDSDDLNQEHLQYICETMNVSMTRAIEAYSVIGPEAVQKLLDSRGGRK